MENEDDRGVPRNTRPGIRLSNREHFSLPELWGSLATLSRNPNFQDARLIFSDGELRSSRLLLSLSCSFLAPLVRESKDGELVVLLPQFKTREVSSQLDNLLQEHGALEFVKDEVPSDNDNDSQNDDNNISEADMMEPKVEMYEEEDYDRSFRDQNKKVEAILGKRRREDRIEYLVKWKGFQEGHVETWEERQNLDCDHLVRKFESLRRQQELELPKMCQICPPEGLKLPSNTIHHYQSHHEVSSLYVCPCPLCWEWFPSEEELEGHVMFHGEDPTKLRCSVCPFSCTAQTTGRRFFGNSRDIPVGQSSLNIHLKTHDNEAQPTCNVCGKEFKHLQALKSHLVSHEAMSQMCQYCNASFRNARLLDDHIKLKHTGELDYSCDNCGTKFPSNNALKRHQKTHSNERPFVCDECGKAFKNKKDVKVHFKLLHTNERPFKCSFEGCLKSFANNPDKTKHERIHTGEKPFKCEICGTAFRQTKHLSKHRMTHTGERPFVCQTCGKGFIQKSNMNIHQTKCSLKFGQN